MRVDYQTKDSAIGDAAGGFLGMLIIMVYAPLNALGLPPFPRQIGLIILAASYLLCGGIFAFVDMHGVLEAG